MSTNPTPPGDGGWSSSESDARCIQPVFEGRGEGVVVLVDEYIPWCSKHELTRGVLGRQCWNPAFPRYSTRYNVVQYGLVNFVSKQETKGTDNLLGEVISQTYFSDWGWP